MESALRSLEIYQRPQRRKLRVVKPKIREEKTQRFVKNKAVKRAQSGLVAKILKRIFVFSLCLGLSGISLGLLMSSLLRYNELTKINREIRTLQADIEALKAQNDSLEIQLAPFTAKERIEQLAKHRLGMTYPSVANQLIIPSSLAMNQEALPSEGGGL